MTTRYLIVGTSFRANSFDLTKVESGTPVKLVREPSNGYDPNAIMVWIDGNHVGYIPKKNNAALAQFIDQTGEPWTEHIPIGDARADSPMLDIRRAIEAKLTRSPNSKYPMVEVE